MCGSEFAVYLSLSVAANQLVGLRLISSINSTYRSFVYVICHFDYTLRSLL